MKLANPLYYPIAVLAGMIVLVVGVRFANISSLIAIPTAAIVATTGASVLKFRQSKSLNLDNPELERQLQAVREQAEILAANADSLRLEATRLLTDARQMELLGTVQYACDRAHELPTKVDDLVRRLHGRDSLLSVDDLQRQLKEVQSKLRKSSGVARTQLTRMATSLQRNIQLAQQGEDARQAQVVSLSTLILDSAGVLQELQNKLRSLNLADAQEAQELRSLSDEFSAFQENVDLLISQ